MTDVRAGKVSLKVLDQPTDSRPRTGKVSLKVLDQPTDSNARTGKVSLKVLVLNNIQPIFPWTDKVTTRWHLDVNGFQV